MKRWAITTQMTAGGKFTGLPCASKDLFSRWLRLFRFYWGPIVDGIFSWESAWPDRNGFGGVSIGDVSVDMKPLAGAHAHNKAYMMGAFLPVTQRSWFD